MVFLCHRFSEFFLFPDKTVIDIFAGLTNGSMPDFVKLLVFHLQQANAEAPVRMLILTIGYILQASGMLANGQLDTSMLFAENMRRKDILSVSVLNKRI